MLCRPWQDKLTESFLWLPSLEGPVSDYTKGVGWLFGDEAQGYAWQGFNPPLGWDDTLAYLTLPVILVISQYISTSILTPKVDDPAQQQSQAILKFLPLMIGWFSLNVPSGLGLYWITNNIVTTLTTVLIRRSVTAPAMAGADSAPMAAAAPPKPQGFGRSFGEVITKRDDSGGTVTITPPGAPSKRERRKAAAAAEATVIEASVVTDAAPAAPAVVDAAPAAVPAKVAEAPHMGAEAGGDEAPVSKPRKKRKKSKRKKK